MGRAGTEDDPGLLELQPRTGVALYHCSPSAARERLKRFGVDPSRSEHGRWDEQDSGFYAFTDLKEARWYASVMAHQDPVESFDIWEVESTCELEPDGSLHSGGDSGESSAVYHREVVSTERIRLLATYQPGFGWSSL